MIELTRLQGWEDRLIEAVADHSQRPFSWGGITNRKPDGGSDCFMQCMDVCLAITGVDPYAAERGRYSTAGGALKRFKRRGFLWLDDAYSAVFPDMPRALARRGDIGLVETTDGDCSVVIMGTHAFGKSPTGNIRVPVAHVRKAFKVG